MKNRSINEDEWSWGGEKELLLFSGFGHEGGRRTLRSSMFYCKILFENKERLMEEGRKLDMRRWKQRRSWGNVRYGLPCILQGSGDRHEEGWSAWAWKRRAMMGWDTGMADGTGVTPELTGDFVCFHGMIGLIL